MDLELFPRTGWLKIAFLSFNRRISSSRILRACCSRQFTHGVRKREQRREAWNEYSKRNSSPIPRLCMAGAAGGIEKRRAVRFFLVRFVKRTNLFLPVNRALSTWPLLLFLQLYNELKTSPKESNDFDFDFNFFSLSPSLCVVYAFWTACRIDQLKSRFEIDVFFRCKGKVHWWSCEYETYLNFKNIFCE